MSYKTVLYQKSAKLCCSMLLLVLAGGVASAQHAGHNMQNMDMPADSNAHTTHEMPSMSHVLSLNLPMSRNGSGTSWNPDAAPMYGLMAHANGWMFMFHGDIFPRYNKQDLTEAGSRGGEIFDAPDMLMVMGQRNVGAKGLFHFNVMLSTDAIITSQNGYPLLFQTGESAHGKPLVDRQHPHDLFSELSVSYSHSFSKKTDISVYVGYPGEPALGPVTFMHRISGQFMPDAPISHHWVDATHITFGVATFGLRYGKFKIEGSSFTGREPNENRYDFDQPKFDSWSTRLSFNPDRHWALQVSHGFIKSPEELRPLEDVQRNTASATYVSPMAKGGFFAATALWGQNINDGNLSNAILLEATLKPDRLAVYTRFEWVQKSVEELNLDATVYGDEHHLFPINTITIGGAYDMFQLNAITIAGGAQFSLYSADKSLDPLYGTGLTALEIYLHIYPKMMNK